MILNDETTWPDRVIAFLEKRGQPLLDYELMMTGKDISFNGLLYDSVHRELTDLLLPYKIENAFHCTRLTDDEINFIQKQGMQLPNLDTLNSRIDKLVQTGLLSKAISENLKFKNEANEQYRKDILHFVFQSPHLEGEGGIARFFTSWGGEALYNAHEEDPVTGPVLAGIGRPCIIQARIPIANMGRAYFNTKIARIYFKNRGLRTEEPTSHEDHTKQPIPPDDVIAIFQFPEKRFLELSGCQTWRDTFLNIH
ncbi:hypothetical protein TH53_25005 [Pedobacter lusitanus]|uniref:Uncharacterized protein n=1 Tax=Pedobacter lusitanus TaxID=1503925 RepID=A0A0D0GET1_9SPHI|nr:hypothetical protein [Pedobacter lusitanus]KIO74690.1 hypothetical protein TH53_25005 [Pedobacter lusitanus]